MYNIYIYTHIQGSVDLYGSFVSSGSLDFCGDLGLKIGHSQTCWLITVFPIKIEICGYAWVRVSMHGYAPLPDTDGFADCRGCFGGPWHLWIMGDDPKGNQLDRSFVADFGSIWIESEKTIAVSHGHQIYSGLLRKCLKILKPLGRGMYGKHWKTSPGLATDVSIVGGFWNTGSHWQI